jgi:hypothetical protein
MTSQYETPSKTLQGFPNGLSPPPAPKRRRLPSSIDENDGTPSNKMILESRTFPVFPDGIEHLSFTPEAFPAFFDEQEAAVPVPTLKLSRKDRYEDLFDSELLPSKRQGRALLLSDVDSPRTVLGRTPPISPLKKLSLVPPPELAAGGRQDGGSFGLSSCVHERVEKESLTLRTSQE